MAPERDSVACDNWKTNKNYNIVDVSIAFFETFLLSTVGL